MESSGRTPPRAGPNASAFFKNCSARSPSNPVATPIAIRAGRIDGSLHAKGLRVALADLLIGATALELGYSVVTHNMRHFEMIPNLEVKQLP